MDKLPALVDVPGALLAGDVPTCSDCPYSLADPGIPGVLVCRRYPPEVQNIPVPISALPKPQQLGLTKEQHQQGFVMSRQSSFTPVGPQFLCGEHPDFPLDDEEEPTANH
jgi:hypothetical protein